MSSKSGSTSKSGSASKGKSASNGKSASESSAKKPSKGSGASREIGKHEQAYKLRNKLARKERKKKLAKEQAEREKKGVVETAAEKKERLKKENAEEEEFEEQQTQARKEAIIADLKAQGKKIPTDIVFTAKKKGKKGKKDKTPTKSGSKGTTTTTTTDATPKDSAKKGKKSVSSSKKKEKKEKEEKKAAKAARKAARVAKKAAKEKAKKEKKAKSKAKKQSLESTKRKAMLATEAARDVPKKIFQIAPFRLRALECLDKQTANHLTYLESKSKKGFRISGAALMALDEYCEHSLIQEIQKAMIVQHWDNINRGNQPGTGNLYKRHFDLLVNLANPTSALLELDMFQIGQNSKKTQSRITRDPNVGVQFTDRRAKHGIPTMDEIRNKYESVQLEYDKRLKENKAKAAARRERAKQQ